MLLGLLFMARQKLLAFLGTQRGKRQNINNTGLKRIHRNITNRTSAKTAAELYSKTSAASSSIVARVTGISIAVRTDFPHQELSKLGTIHHFRADKATLNITFCFACASAPTHTKTCWLHLFVSAQVWTYHPLVTELPCNKNRIQGKTNIIVDIKKKNPFEMKGCIPQTAQVIALWTVSMGFVFSYKH